MPSVSLVHHVYSSVGGYKTIYVTADPAAERVQQALVAVANTAYKGGMGATFRGFLRYQLPVPQRPRTHFGPWQLPPSIALGSGCWYLKSFPMGTDHVGRPRACVHSIVILPERFHPPAWWQPNPLAQLESALVSAYDCPTDSLFLTGRDSLQGLRERTRDQIPWQPAEGLNRLAGLEWLVAGNLPPALVGSMLKLLLFPGSRLFLLGTEEQALFLARILECILPGSYRRMGGLLLGPHYRYLVAPLCPPNLIQIARPSEYPQGECLVDLTAAQPRWIGPEPPVSPLAGAMLEFLNRRDLTGLLRFIEMWDMLDEQAPTPARQIGGLTAMTSLKLIGPEASLDPFPDWTRDAARCASALPFLIQAGWLAAHDTAWRQVKTALHRIGAEHLAGEVKAWDAYLEGVTKQPTQTPPPPPLIKGIVSELEGPSHSKIIAAIDDSLPDKEWEVKGSGHAIPIEALEALQASADDSLALEQPDSDPSAHNDAGANAADDIDDEFAIPAGHLDDDGRRVDPGDSQDPDVATRTEIIEEGTDIDAEFALPALADGDPPAQGSAEPQTVREDWSAPAKPAQPATPPTGRRSSGQGAAPGAPTPARISSALEDDQKNNPATSGSSSVLLIAAEDHAEPQTGGSTATLLAADTGSSGTGLTPVPPAANAPKAAPAANRPLPNASGNRPALPRSGPSPAVRPAPSGGGSSGVRAGADASSGIRPAPLRPSPQQSAPPAAHSGIRPTPLPPPPLDDDEDDSELVDLMADDPPPKPKLPPKTPPTSPPPKPRKSPPPQ